VGRDKASDVNASRAALALKRDAVQAVGNDPDAVAAAFKVTLYVDDVEAWMGK
jgi:hypothetical protein